MVRTVRKSWVLSVSLLLATACAIGAHEDREPIDRLDRAATAGVATVRRALADPAMTFPELGAGVEAVEVSARELRRISEDPSLSPMMRVFALVAEARAYDDLAIVFETTRSRREQADWDHVLDTVLTEKATPARAAAADAYVRARSLACRAAIAEPSVMLEILDGVSRYVGENAVTQPCPE